MKECPHKDDADKQKDCKHYKARKDKPKVATDWICFYYRKINGSDLIHWCDGMYEKAEGDK
jgi:hypothetical protein